MRPLCGCETLGSRVGGREGCSQHTCAFLPRLAPGREHCKSVLCVSVRNQSHSSPETPEKGVSPGHFEDRRSRAKSGPNLRIPGSGPGSSLQAKSRLSHPGSNAHRDTPKHPQAPDGRAQNGVSGRNFALDPETLVFL